MQLEKQLEKLSEFQLINNVSADMVLAQVERETLEARPFDLLIAILGSEDTYESQDDYLSQKLWHFDEECIVDGNSYAEIANRLASLAGVPECLTEFTYFVDDKTEKHKLSFVANGKKRTFQIKMKDDWVDLKALRNLMHSIERHTKGAFFEYGTWGFQDRTIMFVSEGLKGKFANWGMGLLNVGETYFNQPNRGRK